MEQGTLDSISWAINALRYARKLYEEGNTAEAAGEIVEARQEISKALAIDAALDREVAVQS